MKPSPWRTYGLTLFLAAGLLGCSNSHEPDNTPPPEEEEVGFEIIEFSPGFPPLPARAWISPQITREEFEALELPEGWQKNQPREGDADGGNFPRSPDTAPDGEVETEELFGFTWFYAAKVVSINPPLDAGGLLESTTVIKYHEVIFNAGSTLTLLESPDGDVYFRIGRDADRTSDNPAIPNTWRLGEYTTPERLVIELFGGNTVIRTDNEDSFQGPVPQLKGLLP